MLSRVHLKSTITSDSRKGKKGNAIGHVYDFCSDGRRKEELPFFLPFLFFLPTRIDGTRERGKERIDLRGE